MKELKLLLTFYTQAQIAEMLGYKHRSSVNKMIKNKKIPMHKRGIITKELNKCLRSQVVK